MPAGDGLDLVTTARAVLDAVVAHYAEATTTALPDRRVIVPGETRVVAWDCESVLITCAGIGWGQGPGTGSATARPTGNPVSVVPRHIAVGVQIVREVPESDGMTPPDADELTKAGVALLRDVGLLSQALVELCGPRGALGRAGTAVPGVVQTVGPSGGYAAAEGTLQVTANQLVPL